MEIERIGVIGAGLMGSEIAQVAAAAAIDVVLVDVDEASVSRGVARIHSIGARRVERGRLTADEASAIEARVTAATDITSVRTCDVVIEAGPEVLDLKLDLWRAIDAAAPAHAILASNTSGLSITTLANVTSRPEKVLGLHFFNPASVMRLVEVIQGATTDAETIEAATTLTRRLGKEPVRVTECPGFLVNRILVRALAEAYRATDEHDADLAAIDRAVVNLGPAPMGPFALGDLIGLDTTLHVQRDLERAYGDRFAAGGLLAAQVAAGRLGAKSGAGFVTDAAETEATSAASHIADRYYLAAFDEACRCLDEGIAALPDIDVAMQLGTGWVEGPFAWADGQGLHAVRARLVALPDTAAERFAPQAALVSRIAEHTTFTTTPEEGS